jgi:hypothetical protein
VILPDRQARAWWQSGPTLWRPDIERNMEDGGRDFRTGKVRGQFEQRPKYKGTK